MKRARRHAGRYQYPTEKKYANEVRQRSQAHGETSMHVLHAAGRILTPAEAKRKHRGERAAAEIAKVFSRETTIPATLIDAAAKKFNTKTGYIVLALIDNHGLMVEKKGK